MFRSCPQTIDIIDPVRLTVVASITEDQIGAPLTNAGSDGAAGSVNETRTWNDAVFLQVSGCSRRTTRSIAEIMPPPRGLIRLP